MFCANRFFRRVVLIHKERVREIEPDVTPRRLIDPDRAVMIAVNLQADALKRARIPLEGWEIFIADDRGRDVPRRI